MGIGRRIRDLRLRAGMSQSDLAGALGHTDRRTVSRWERGIHEPRASTLADLSAALDAPLNAFLQDAFPEFPSFWEDIGELVRLFLDADSTAQMIAVAEAKSALRRFSKDRKVGTVVEDEAG